MSNFKITPEILRNLQQALNDSIKPDFKENSSNDKKGDKPKKRKRKKQSPNGSSERSDVENAVQVQS